MSEKINVSENKYEQVNPKIVFPIVAMALLMITVDSTIVATALHTLQMDLQTSVSWAGWTLTIYSFGFVLMLPLSAKLSIRFGNRPVFLLSVATFTLASLLCGLSTNIHMLIAMRALQAIGGSGLTPSATGLIVNHFNQSRDKFLGLFGSIFAIGGYDRSYIWRDICYILYMAMDIFYQHPFRSFSFDFSHSIHSQITSSE